MRLQEKNCELTQAVASTPPIPPIWDVPLCTDATIWLSVRTERSKSGHHTIQLHVTTTRATVVPEVSCCNVSLRIFGKYKI